MVGVILVGNLLATRVIYLVVATIVVGIAVLIGLIFLVLPGLYLAVRFALYPAAVMVDGEGPIGGLSESWDRTSGHGLTVFGFYLAVGLPAIVLLVLLYSMPVASP